MTPSGIALVGLVDFDRFPGLMPLAYHLLLSFRNSEECDA